MAKAKKVLSTVLAALMVVMTVASYVPAKAAKAVVPQIKLVEQPKAEYKVGDRMYTKVQCANFSGKVEYRATLWDGSEKKTIEVWKTFPYYYKNWQPTGKTVFPITWIVEKPGVYNLTIYVRPVGSKVPYSTYTKSANFTVKSADVTVDSIAPVADVTVNEGEKVTLPEKVTLNMSDKTTKEAKVTWAAVDTTKVGETNVEGTVEGTDKKATVKVVVKAVDLKVESVSAINLKEFDIKFSKAIDKDNIGEYKINKADLTDNDSVELLEDGKTVRITFDVAKKNQTTYSVAISGVKGTDGKELAAVTKDVTVLDTILPVVEKVEAKGNKRITITLSEPIVKDAASTSYANYKIDGKLIAGSGLPSVDGRVITLTLGTALAAGEHELTIVPNKVTDYNNFKISDNATKFTVVDDKDAPTVEVKSAAQEKVTLQFNEEINNDVLRVYWKNGNVKNYASIKKDRADKTIIYAIFDNGHYVPLTETTLYVENAMDYSGNTAATKEFKISAVADVTRPTVVEVTSVKETQIIVKFSENVDALSGTFTIKDKDGRTVAFDSQSYVTDAAQNTYKNQIKLTKAAKFDVALNPYTVKVEKVADLSALKNESLPQIFTVSVPDTTAPAIKDVRISGNTLAFYFDEKVDPATSANSDNYAYFETKYGYVPFPAEATFTALSDGRSVIVTLPTSWKFQGEVRTIANIQGTSAISVKNITDLAGNKMFAMLWNAPDKEEAAKVISAKAVDANTIVLQLGKGALPTAPWVGDFLVKAGDKELTVIDAQISTKNNTITLTTAQSMSSTVKYGTPAVPVIVGMRNAVEYTKTALGTPLSVDNPNGTLPIADNIAATVDVENIKVVGNTVIIPFDEDIQYGIANDAEVLAKALIVKDSDTLRLAPKTDYTAVIDTNKIIITVIKPEFEDILSISLDGIYLQDKASVPNDIKSFAVNTGNDMVKVPTNKASLTAAIAIAQGKYDAAIEGTKVGQYATGSKTALKVAIDEATVVNKNTSATQTDVDAAISKLNTAITTFDSKIVVAKVTTVDVAGNNNITIPAADTPVVESYTATVKDQDGNTLTGQAIVWSIKTTVAGANIATDGKLTVDKTAAAGTVTIVATVGTVSKDYTVTLAK